MKKIENIVNTVITRHLLRDEEGQSLVEWTLILALISVVAIAILGTIGTNLASKLTDIATQI